MNNAKKKSSLTFARKLNFKEIRQWNYTDSKFHLVINRWQVRHFQLCELSNDINIMKYVKLSHANDI